MVVVVVVVVEFVADYDDGADGDDYSDFDSNLRTLQMVDLFHPLSHIIALVGQSLETVDVVVVAAAAVDYSN